MHKQPVFEELIDWSEPAGMSAPRELMGTSDHTLQCFYYLTRSWENGARRAKKQELKQSERRLHSLRTTWRAPSRLHLRKFQRTCNKRWTTRKQRLCWQEKT